MTRYYWDETKGRVEADPPHCYAPVDAVDFAMGEARRAVTLDRRIAELERAGGADRDTGVRPSYYRARVRTRDAGDVDVECFALIDALGLDFYAGNTLKYLWRAGRKTESDVEDLRKARTYLDAMIKQRENAQ